MAILKIRSGDWVVVCDGAKALILQNAGDGMHPNLKTREVYGQPDAKTHDQFDRFPPQRDGADGLA